MSPAPHVSPKVRAYGKARIDITRRAKDEEEWRRLWKEPTQPYPFIPGEGWKLNVVYCVDDYAAEIGFFIDVLGFPVMAFSPSRAQFTDPEGSFVITIIAAREGVSNTPAEALRLQLNVREIIQTIRELERRGVALDRQPEPVMAGFNGQIAAFRTPNGVTVELFGEMPVEDTSPEIPYGSVDEPAGQTQDDDAIWSDDHLPQVEGEGAGKQAKIKSETFADQDDENKRERAGDTQSSIWSRIPAGPGKLKASGVKRQEEDKPGNGNMELTYDTLEDSEHAGFSDADEDYP